MSAKLIALLGHLLLAGLFIFGFEQIQDGHTITFLAILFSVVGLWSALGAPKSTGFSLGMAILIWLSIAIWIFVSVLNRDLAATDPHSKSEGGQFFLVIADIAVLVFILVSFALGRFGYFLFTKLDKKG